MWLRDAFDAWAGRGYSGDAYHRDGETVGPRLTSHQFPLYDGHPSGYKAAQVMGGRGYLA